MRTPPHLEWKVCILIGEGDWDEGRWGQPLRPPQTEWKVRVLMVDCHHPPPPMQGAMHAGELGRVDGGGGQPLKPPPKLN